MHSYEIYHTSDNSRELRSYRFQADTLSDALEIARDAMILEKGLLIEDGRPVCSFALVSGTGVWLVGSPQIVEDEICLRADA